MSDVSGSPCVHPAPVAPGKAGRHTIMAEFKGSGVDDAHSSHGSSPRRSSRAGEFVPAPAKARHTLSSQRH